MQISSCYCSVRSYSLFFLLLILLLVLKSLHWLKINERIKYKLLSLTYKVLTTNQPQYLHDLISVQPCHNTRSSSMVTLARPPTRSSLKITHRSFKYAAPSLWNELPLISASLVRHSLLHYHLSHMAVHHHLHHLHYHHLHLLLLVQYFILNSRLGSSANPFLQRPFPFLTGLIPRTLGPSNDFSLLNGWICLHGVLD